MFRSLNVGISLSASDEEEKSDAKKCVAARS
jgi:hypothetical protein